MSFAEWTATSIRRSSSASSSSFTKTPREPISPNGRERSRSPAVVIGTSASSIPGARNADSGALGLGEREPTAATADADEHRRVVLRTGGAHPTPRGRTRMNAVGAWSGRGRAGDAA